MVILSSLNRYKVSVFLVPLFFVIIYVDVYFGLSGSFTKSLSKEKVKIRQRGDSVIGDKDRRLPRALIIGFDKCGSSALRSFLSVHPDIVSPSLEQHFFDDHYKRGLEWYKRQMPISTSSQITIEKTPGYIKTIESLRRIYDFNPNVKLLVIVRNPVTRLQSEYAHVMSKQPENSNFSFTDWILRDSWEARIRRFSDFASKIRQAYSIFPEHQFLIVSEEDLEKDPVSVVKQAEIFLKLRPAVTRDVFVFNETKGFYCFNRFHPFFLSVLEDHAVDIMSGCMNSNKGRDHPSLDAELLHKIVKYSIPYVEDFFRVIHKKFDWKYYNKYIQKAY